MNDVLHGAISNLITTYNDGVETYAELDGKLKEQVADERVTPKVAEEQRRELQSTINRKLSELNDNVQELLVSSMEAQEKKAREQLTTTLDANGSGELMLLATMDDITHGDLKNYLEKYSDKPLAIKKLKQIAKSNNITLVLTEEQQKMADPMATVAENKRRIDELVSKNSYFNTGAAAGMEMTKRKVFDFKESDIEQLRNIQRSSL